MNLDVGRIKMFTRRKKVKRCRTQFGREEYDSFATQWEWMTADLQSKFSTIFIRARMVISESKMLRKAYTKWGTQKTYFMTKHISVAWSKTLSNFVKKKR